MRIKLNDGRIDKFMVIKTFRTDDYRPQYRNNDYCQRDGFELFQITNENKSKVIWTWQGPQNVDFINIGSINFIEGFIYNKSGCTKTSTQTLNSPFEVYPEISPRVLTTYIEALNKFKSYTSVIINMENRKKIRDLHLYNGIVTVRGEYGEDQFKYDYVINYEEIFFHLFMFENGEYIHDAEPREIVIKCGESTVPDQIYSFSDRAIQYYAKPAYNLIMADEERPGLIEEYFKDIIYLEWFE